jgi:hypothetical protein
MFRKLQLAAAIAVALSAVGTTDSADAHVRGRGGVGGGIRIGGGLAPRARLPGNANGNRIGGNPPIAGRVTPVPLAPKVATPKPAAPPAASLPIVQIGGTSSDSKSPAKRATANASKPTDGSALTNTTQSNPPPSKQAPVPATNKVTQPEHLVFNLTGNAARVEDLNATETPTVEPKGLSSETKQALEDALAADVPAAEIAPTEVATKEVPLPQIPVGATVTLNGNDLSDKEGQVVLQIGEIALPATITEWKNNLVTCTLPVLGLTKTSKATLHVLKADGKTASLLNCELVIPLPAR